MHDMIESVMVGSARMVRGWVEVWTTHMLWPACDLDRVGRCGALVGPSNIGKWCAIRQHQLHARLRRLPYRHDEWSVYTIIGRGTERSHGSVGRAE
jgi:hypothetical protein